MHAKKSLVALLAAVGALSGGLAQAQNHVQWSVQVGGPVAVQVYSPGAPAYRQAPVLYPVQYQAQYPVQYPVQYSLQYPVQYPVVLPVVTPAQRPYYPHHAQYQQPTRWDVDGDGIPNRYDRVYNPRWDRDGDGMPNRFDRHDGRRDDVRGGVRRDDHREQPRHDGRDWRYGNGR